MSHQRSVLSAFAILILACGVESCAHAQAANHPVTASELLSIVAGESLDQNVVHVLESRGIAFKPTDGYRSLLTNAGADKSVLGALTSARVDANAADPEKMESPEFLQHLANAGESIRAKDFNKAGAELNAALQIHLGPEAGFVMGDLLDDTKQWDHAGGVYTKVLQMFPEFPGAHARLAFDAYKFGEADTAIQEAHAALLQFKDDPEAHKNMGLGMQISGQLDGAISEYREALRLKPDYAAVHCDLGLVYDIRLEKEDAIKEMKKAIALESDQPIYHYDLGNILRTTGDLDGSIREFRAAKGLDPSWIDVRQNLANALGDKDREAAKTEFHELIDMSPDFELARLGLGKVLLDDGDYKNAETEFRNAARLDPSDADSFAGIGNSLERQGKFQDAIVQLQHALDLNCDCANVHIGLGRAYSDLKDYPSALKELRKAVSIEPANWFAHTRLSEALANSGDLDGAIAEARESIRVAPNDPLTHVMLAKYLEKKEDLAGALKQCVLASTWPMEDEATADCAGIQKRLGLAVTFHLRPGGTSESSPKASSATVPASTEGKHLPGPKPAPVIDARPGETMDAEWQKAFNAGQQALYDLRFADAEKSLEAAAARADRLRPFNENALRTFDLLGAAYLRDDKIDRARTTFQRELDLTEKILGPQSEMNQRPLDELARVAQKQRDFASAEKFFLMELDNAEKNYDPLDTRITIFLSQIGDFYSSQKEFDKGEPYLQHAYEISKQLDGGAGPISEAHLAKLQILYVAWGKYEKAEPYSRKLLAIREERYGANSRAVADSLQTLADELEKLGRTEEANNLRKRSAAILGANAAPNK